MMSKIIYGLILAELLMVAVIDFKTAKISNKWPLINLGLSIICYVGLSQLYPFSWRVFLFPIGFIVIGFFLFLANIMGAGDSKYLASLFLVLPEFWHIEFFEMLLTSTMLVGAILFLLKLIKNVQKFKLIFINRSWTEFMTLIRSRFSYAPVVLLAWLLLGVNVWR